MTATPLRLAVDEMSTLNRFMPVSDNCGYPDLEDC